MTTLCPQCDEQTTVLLLHCEACGVDLTVACAGCGFANRLGDRYCGGCGTNLPEPSASGTAGPELAAAQRDELRTITVMMADLDGFAEMAEQVGRERATGVMNAVYERLAGLHIVQSFDGYIDKLLDGDIMALFGAPVAHEDSPERALRAAVRMHTSLGDLHTEGVIPAATPVRLRIGLNTGPVRVGGVGAGGRMEYTAMGDTVNLAARLMTAASWGQSLISSQTYRRCEGSFELTPLEPIRVKGKSQPVPIWSVESELRRAARIELAASQGMSRLVGRDDLLDLLRDSWQAAAVGQGSALGVRGDAGLGKSRLIYELVKELDPERCHVLEGRCVSYGSSLSYLPMREVVAQLLGLAEADGSPERAAKVAAAVANWCPDAEQAGSALAFLFGLPGEDETWQNAEPQQRRTWLREAVVALVVGAAAQLPVLLFVDDVQWLDDDSAELLDRLVAAAPEASMLALVAYRPSFEPPWPEPFLGLDLWRLTLAETRQVVGSLMAVRGLVADEKTVADSLAEAVHAKSQGNPFFIEQLVTALVDYGEREGRPAIDFRRGRLCITEDELGRLAPDSVEEILLARMDTLPSEPRALLQAASVVMLGTRFRRSALQSVLERDVQADLAQLIDREYIHVSDRSADDEEYAFDNALARDVAYGALLRAERRRLHGRMGAWIEQRYPAELDALLDELSYHYYNSSLAAKALVYLPRSAERAARIFSNQLAMVQFKRALEKADELGAEADPADRLAVLRGLTTVQTLVGDPETVTFVEQRLELARTIGDRQAVIDASYMLARRHTELGEFERAMGYFEQALAAYGELGDAEGVRDTHFGMGNLYYLQGRLDLALLQFEQALAVQLDQLPYDAFGRWVAYNNLAAAYDGLGRYKDMLGACDTCRALLEDFPTGDPLRLQLETYTLGNTGSAQRNLGHLREAKETYAEALANAQATGERTVEAEVRYWLGRTLLYLDDLDDSAAQLDEALALARETGHPRWEVASLVALADVDRLGGQFAQAAERIELARDVARRVADVAGSEEIDLAASRLAVDQGDGPEAERLAQGAAEQLEASGQLAALPAAWLDIAQAQLAQGKDAAELLQKALNEAVRREQGEVAKRAKGLLGLE